VLKPSRGEHGTIFLQTRDAGANAVPTVVVAGEHYNNLIRLLENRVPVTVKVNVQGRYFTQDTSGYNVIAELPGSPNEISDTEQRFPAARAAADWRGSPAWQAARSYLVEPLYAPRVSASSYDAKKVS